MSKFREQNDELKKLTMLAMNAHAKIDILARSLGLEEQRRLLGDHKIELTFRRRLPGPLAKIRDWWEQRLTK